jgi:hypothetical protein
MQAYRMGALLVKRAFEVRFATRLIFISSRWQLRVAVRPRADA